MFYETLKVFKNRWFEIPDLAIFTRNLRVYS